MEDMPPTPAHARPSRQDHLWVLAIIAAFALFDVWESWTQVGNKSGFAHGTGWTLTVIVEAFAGYCLWAWFSAPGRRSRRFAMWAAITALAGSLVGQGSSTLAAHAMPPIWLAVFVKDLPVVVLALIAILAHVRRLDRADAAAAEQAQREAERQAQRAAAEEDELAVLRAQIAAQAEELSAAQSDLAAAQQQAAEATAKAEAAARKLAATAASKRGRKAPQKKPAAVPATRVPRDVNVQAQALSEVAANPGITGKELGPLVGRSERWGQDFLKNLAAAPRGPEETP